MCTISFDRARWMSWKAQLESLADAPALSRKDVQLCLQSLREIEMGEAERSTTTPHDTLTNYLASSSAAPRKDATTQLCTVHPIHYAHHVLTKVKFQRQVRKLSIRVGQLGATLCAVAENLWQVLLQVLGSHSRDSGAHPTRQSSSGDVPPTSTTLSSAILPASHAGTPLLSSEACQAMSSLLGQRAGFDMTLLSAFSVMTVEKHASQVEEATQTSDELLAAETSAVQRQRLPFLCRRCRQDGRTGYEYDKEKQRLVHSRALLAETTTPPPSTAQFLSRGKPPPPRPPPARTEHGATYNGRRRSMGGTQKQGTRLPHL